MKNSYELEDFEWTSVLLWLEINGRPKTASGDACRLCLLEKHKLRKRHRDGINYEAFFGIYRQDLPLPKDIGNCKRRRKAAPNTAELESFIYLLHEAGVSPKQGPERAAGRFRFAPGVGTTRLPAEFR